MCTYSWWSKNSHKFFIAPPIKGRGYFPTSWFFVTCFGQPNAMQVTLCDFQSSPWKVRQFPFSPSLISWGLMRKPGLAVGKGHEEQNWGTPANSPSQLWDICMKSSKISQPPTNYSLTTNVCVNPMGTTWSSVWPPRQSAAQTANHRSWANK